MEIHIDYGVREDCKNLKESYGEICVKCNKCGRFNEHDSEIEAEEDDSTIVSAISER